MLYEDCYDFFEAIRAKKRGKVTTCNFEIGVAKGRELVAYGAENFKGDWSYRETDNSTMCVYLNDEKDRLLMLLGFSEFCHDPPINNGKKWFRP